MLSEVFKALSDENRLRIVHLLMGESLCVCELETLLEMNQSNVSRHLNRLKVAGIIRPDKHQQWVHYDLEPDFLEAYEALQGWIRREALINQALGRDRRRLELYRTHGLTCTDIKERLQEVKHYLEGDHDKAKQSNN